MMRYVWKILVGFIEPRRVVTSILTQPRKRLEAESTAEPPLRQIIGVLQQVMSTHDAEKLALSVLEIYEGDFREEQSSKW